MAKKQSKPTEKKADSPTFEEAVERLKRIVHDLEEGEIGLDDSLRRYEEGVRLIRLCTTQLEKAERRLEMLERVDNQGAAVTRPMDDAEMSLEEKAGDRSRRRTAAKKEPERGEGPPFEPDADMDSPGRLF